MLNVNPEAEKIMQTLVDNGHKAYLVGGCVRDILMSRRPHDFDIATSAKPDDVKGLFEKVVPTGEKHGTVTVMIGENGYEVTTFRIDGKYSDSRHPDSVTFTDDIVADLSRRDFTMNAMAMDLRGDIIDPFNGQEDIEKKTIRCVGNAGARLIEDPLRELRAVRFACQLGFNLHKDVLRYLKGTTFLHTISAERIRDELVKIFMSSPVYGIQLLHQCLFWDFIFPYGCGFNETDFVFNSYHCFDIYTHSLMTLDFVQKNCTRSLALRLAAWLHDTGKREAHTVDDNGVDRYKGHAKTSVEIAEKWMRELRFENDLIKKVSDLIKYHDTFIEDASTSSMRAAVIRMLGNFDKNYDMMALWLDLRAADIHAQNSFYMQNRLDKLAAISILLSEIREQDACVKRADLKINGKDLINMGITDGRKIGKIIEALLTKVINSQLDNDKEKLLEAAKAYT